MEQKIAGYLLLGHNIALSEIYERLQKDVVLYRAG
jgi:hypothetical protein